MKYRSLTTDGSGFLWPVCFILVGLILLFCRETRPAGALSGIIGR